MIVEFDLMFKRGGNKIEIRKSLRLKPFSGITVMTWIKSTEDGMDMAIFHSKSLGINFQDKVSIDKANER